MLIHAARMENFTLLSLTGQSLKRQLILKKAKLFAAHMPHPISPKPAMVFISATWCRKHLILQKAVYGF